MPTTFVILIKRWPEVVLIVALALFGTLGIELIGPNMEQEPSVAGAILLIGTILFYLVQMILHLGFVRTAYTDGTTAQEPAVLFKTGGNFFWRFFLFSMAYAGLYLLLGLVIFFLMNKVGVIKAGFDEAEVWARNLCFVASSLLLVKIILLPPALIIVRDCGLVSAVMSIGQFKLFSARGPLVLFVILQAITYLAGVLAPVYESKALDRYFYTVVFSLLSALITLAVSISTVRFLARYTPYQAVDIIDRLQDIHPAGQDKEAES